MEHDKTSDVLYDFSISIIKNRGYHLKKRYSKDATNAKGILKQRLMYPMTFSKGYNEFNTSFQITDNYSSFTDVCMLFPTLLEFYRRLKPKSLLQVNFLNNIATREITIINFLYL